MVNDIPGKEYWLNMYIYGSNLNNLWPVNLQAVDITRHRKFAWDWVEMNERQRENSQTMVQVFSCPSIHLHLSVARMTVCCLSTSLVFKIIYLAICSLCSLLPIRAAVSVHMVQQANLNVFFALLLKPIKFTAKKSPDYKAAEPTPPPILSLWCVYSCVHLWMPAIKGDVKSWSGGNVTYFLVVRVPVSLLIHMGAALIKSSGSTIHTTGCLALSKKICWCSVR